MLRQICFKEICCFEHFDAKYHNSSFSIKLLQEDKHISVHAAERYIGNPDPGEDPALGQLASKSLPSQLAEVPNSEDDDMEVPLGNLHLAMEPTEAENGPEPGMCPSQWPSSGQSSSLQITVLYRL